MQSLEVDIGQPTMTYASTSYIVTPNTLSKGTVLTVGGKEYLVALTLNVRQSLFGATKPYAGKRLTYNSIVYRIISVDSDGTGTNYSIHLEDISK